MQTKPTLNTKDENLNIGEVQMIKKDNKKIRPTNLKSHYTEDHVSLLQKEDEIFQSLYKKFYNNLNSFIPRKNINELNQINSRSIIKKIDQKDEIFCVNHENKKAHFICLSPSCQHVFYCMSCHKDHSRQCEKGQIILNIDKNKDSRILEEYTNVEKFDFDEKNSLIEQMIQSKISKFSEYMKILETNFILKLKQSKEFILKKLKDNISGLYGTYKGNKVKKRDFFSGSILQFRP